MANDQPASLPVARRPMPRQEKSGRKLRPIRRQKKNRMSAWVATPRVAVPASSAIMSGVQSVTSRRAVGIGAEQEDEHHETGHGDDVVHHGRPGERAEELVGVEDLAEHRVQAVEEDLRQAPVGEGHGEGPGVRVQPERVEVHENRGASRTATAVAAKSTTSVMRQKLVDVGLAAVGMNDRPDDRGHEDRAEHTAGDDDVERVRQLVGHAERVSAAARDQTDGPREQHRLHEAEDARHHRSGCQEEAGASDSGVLGRLRHRSPGVVVAVAGASIRRPRDAPQERRVNCGARHGACAPCG